MAAAFAAAAVAIAGCGSSGATGSASSSAAGSATSSAAASSSSAPSTTSASSAAGAAAGSTGGSAGASGAVTKPGASLTAGRTATLLYTPPGSTNGPTYKLQVTVKAIKKGTLADFNGIQLNAAEKAGTPEYVRVNIKNIDTKAISGSSDYPAVPLEGVDNTGQSQQSVTFIGDFPACPDNDAPKPFKPGATFDTCLTFLVPGGIKKVSWNGTNAYIDSPVTWTSG